MPGQSEADFAADFACSASDEGGFAGEDRFLSWCRHRKFKILHVHDQIFARRSLSAFPITETELKLMAAAAIIGLKSMPNTG